jgi:predicted dithiol-disulfide oxidoreductase (DUF899 family)
LRNIDQVGQNHYPSSTAVLDQLDGGAPRVEQKGSLVVIAKAPIDRVATFARDRGWRHLRLLSAANNTFKRDCHGEDSNGSQMPNMSVFHRESNGEIRHTWSSELLYEPTDPGQDPRHVGTLEPLPNLFDLTPEGASRKMGRADAISLLPWKAAGTPKNWDERTRLLSGRLCEYL